MKHAMKHAAATYEEGEAAAEYHRRVFEEAHRLIREGDQTDTTDHSGSTDHSVTDHSGTSTWGDFASWNE